MTSTTAAVTTAHENTAAMLADLCRGIGHLATAQRAILDGFPTSDPEVVVPIQWASEIFSKLAASVG